MAQQDKMVYFDLRARGEPIRMLYAIAGQELIEDRHNFAEWSTTKESVKTPLGQLPVLETADGTLCQSTTISRYVAKKLGLVGEGLWNEALNDVIVETLHEFVNKLLVKVLMWKVLKAVPEPEDSEKVVEEIRNDFLHRLSYIRSITEKKGKKSLLCDKIQLADVWLYTTIEWAKLAFTDAVEITPWIKEFVSNFESDPRMKAYLAKRPVTMV